MRRMVVLNLRRTVRFVLKLRAEESSFRRLTAPLFFYSGGWQAAEFAQKTLHQNIEVELANRLGFGHEENDMLGVPRNTEVDGVFAEPVFEGKVHGGLMSSPQTLMHDVC